MSQELIHKIIETDRIPTETLFERKNSVYSYISPVPYLIARKNRSLFLRLDGILMDGSLLCVFVRLFYGFKIGRPAFISEKYLPELFRYAVIYRKSIYIVGGNRQEVWTAVAVWQKQYPSIAIAGYRDGYFSSEEEKEEEYRNIIRRNPDYVFVGMGIITQETFLLNLKRAGYEGIGFAVGGFISQTGMKKGRYYPEWINKHDLRFLYRFYKEKHTRKRYLKTAFLFPLFFVWDRFRGKVYTCGDKKDI